MMGDLKLNIETITPRWPATACSTNSKLAGSAGRAGFGGRQHRRRTDRLDTDQVPHQHLSHDAIMLTVLKYGGFTTGGLNFDARCAARVLSD